MAVVAMSPAGAAGPDAEVKGALDTDTNTSWNSRERDLAPALRPHSSRRGWTRTHSLTKLQPPNAGAALAPELSFPRGRRHPSRTATARWQGPVRTAPLHTSTPRLGRTQTNPARGWLPQPHRHACNRRPRPCHPGPSGRRPRAPEPGLEHTGRAVPSCVWRGSSRGPDWSERARSLRARTRSHLIGWAAGPRPDRPRGLSHGGTGRRSSSAHPGSGVTRGDGHTCARNHRQAAHVLSKPD